MGQPKKIAIHSSLEAYMVSCVYNRIFNYFREKGIKDKHEENFKQFVSQHHSQIAPSAVFLKEEYSIEELLIELEGAIEQMPDKMKEVFLANNTNNYSINELADNFNIAPQTVKNHLQAANQYLRKTVSHHPSEATISLLYFLCLN